MNTGKDSVMIFVFYLPVALHVMTTFVAFTFDILKKATLKRLLEKHLLSLENFLEIPLLF